ncbi:unnamed protein product [Cochlearia groenlandica]
MGVKVGSTSPFLQWASHPSSSSSSPSQTLASGAISSPSKRRSTVHDGRFLSCRLVPHTLNRSSLFGTKLHRSKSCELWESSKPTKTQSVRRFCSASLDPFSEEEFSRKIHELSLRFNVDRDSNHDFVTEKPNNNTPRDSIIEPPSWQHETVHLEMKANSIDLPLSLRIIKKKKRQWEEEEAKQACGSMNKAFSSMVFMIREIQSFALHMREILFYEDLQGILRRVREEMHASFVWLFQQVFSATPTLMVYVMILLANFTVYSIGSNNTALAAAAPTTNTVTEITTVDETVEKFDSSVIKTLFASSPSPNGNNKTSIGGNNNGGGGNVRPVISGTDGDGFEGSEQFRTILPEGASQFSSSKSTLGSTKTESETSVSGQDEHRLWNSMLEEAEQMHDSKIDDETRKRLVSPVDAPSVEKEEAHTDYFKTELVYQTELSQEPNNTLLLANYAQFLYIVSDDYDRAEEYFKRSVGVEPKDAEALSKYATFLWRARDDLWAAEETFLEAIDADPTNSYYAANYANFLWNTGGDETCFPLEDESHDVTV